LFRNAIHLASTHTFFSFVYIQQQDIGNRHGLGPRYFQHIRPGQPNGKKNNSPPVHGDVSKNNIINHIFFHYLFKQATTS